jgi:glycosyltransferase involved in cell wall biosynthesis
LTVRRLIVVCNAVDDATRERRGITTDSPAASNKVLTMCRALRQAGVRPLVLSLGRGRADGSGRRYAPAVRRVQGIPVLYAGFSHRPGLSQVLSLWSPAALLWRARRLSGRKTVLFYNRLPAYVPTLLLAAALRLRRVLDLEDGELPMHGARLRQRLARAVRVAFDPLYDGGALLACRSLAGGTSVRPVACYYGTVDTRGSVPRWPDHGVTALMGGTVSADTGAHLLVGAIEWLRARQPAWAAALRIDVTGQGDAMAALQRLAAQDAWPAVRVHGRVDSAQYRQVLAGAQVGLALKPSVGPLAQTTFPSKVVEFAGAGLLVLTTDISDVRHVLGDGAVYLDEETPAGLAARLRWVVEHREQAQAMAEVGRDRTRAQCRPQEAGERLANFLFGAA